MGSLYPTPSLSLNAAIKPSRIHAASIQGLWKVNSSKQIGKEDEKAKDPAELVVNSPRFSLQYPLDRSQETRENGHQLLKRILQKMLLILAWGIEKEVLVATVGTANVLEISFLENLKSNFFYSYKTAQVIYFILGEFC